MPLRQRLPAADVRHQVAQLVVIDGQEHPYRNTGKQVGALAGQLMDQGAMAIIEKLQRESQ